MFGRTYPTPSVWGARYAAGARRANRKDLAGYLGALEQGRDPIEWKEDFDSARRLGEALMLGLRLVEGVDLDALGVRYGTDVRARYAEDWERAVEAKLVVLEGPRARLTREGWLHSNDVFVAFV